MFTMVMHALSSASHISALLIIIIHRISNRSYFKHSLQSESEF